MATAFSSEPGIGHNAPTDPFLLYSESIGDLLLEASNYLDGKDIENEDQESAVASIFTRLRREAAAADTQRKAEKKPHDEAAKAVQEKWSPLLRKAALGIDSANSALTSFLTKKNEAQRAAAEAAQQEARRKAEAAAQTAKQTHPSDFAGREAAQELQEEAAAALKQAERLGKAKAQAKGGERAVGLKVRYRPEVTDPVAFGKWLWEHRRDDYLAWLDEAAKREFRHGPQSIPGVTGHEERKAV